MSRPGTTLIAILIVALPAPAQRIVDEIIAVVNSDVILKSELESETVILETALAQTFQGAELLEAIEVGRSNVLRDLIDRDLLRQKADEYGVDASLEVVRTMDQLRLDYDFETLDDLESAIVAQGDSVEDYRAMIETSYKTEMVVNQEVYAKIVITNEEAREYYEVNLDEFDRPAGLRLQEIVILRLETQESNEEARMTAEDALERVRDGEEFASVAREVSEVRTAELGGDLGFFETGELSEIYETAAVELQRNEISEIIELPDAFVILKLLDRHEGGILVFELALQEIQGYLTSLQAEGSLREYLNGLRSDGFIDVKDGYIDTGAVETDGAG